ncbi:MAG: hypothetical protein GX595_15110 [Lentisphaerae bacterium]|nr:hypothetical protein [Lentisphaerota bacterium]
MTTASVLPWIAPMLLATTVGLSAATPAASGPYGVRWKLLVDDAADYARPCERTDAAAGLAPADFDRVFPWSQMRLCALRRRPGGGYERLYSDAPRFALDGSAGHVMVEIPRHWSRRSIEDGFEVRRISAEPRPGFSVDPAFVEDGRELERIYVGAYEGVIGADGALSSCSGVYPTADRTRDAFRESARANGVDFGIMDLRTLLMLQNLFLIEHAERDSQKALGMGWGKMLQPARTHRCVRPQKSTNRVITRPPPGRSQAAIRTGLFEGCAVLISSYADQRTVLVGNRTLVAIRHDDPEPGLTSFVIDGEPIDTTEDMCLGGAAQKTGWADQLQGHSGATPGQGEEPYRDYRCAVRYRWMENLWGNLWCFIDGLNYADGRAYVGMAMRDYASGVTTGSYRLTSIEPLPQDDNGNVGGDREIHYMRNLGFDPEAPWLALPQDFTYPGEAVRAGVSETLRHGNFGDYYYFSRTATCSVHGGGFDHYWRCGLFTLRAWCKESTRWYLYGSRLICKELDGAMPPAAP